jgi:hypothetical protein
LVVSGEVRVEEVDSEEGLKEESWGEEEEEEARAGSMRRNMAEVMEQGEGRSRGEERRGRERERESKGRGRRRTEGRPGTRLGGGD